MTRATSTIGNAIARRIADMPCYSVVLLARNESKSIATSIELRYAPDKPKIRYELSDLSCREDILSLAENWQIRLHVLVNNAAETPCQRELTAHVDDIPFHRRLHFAFGFRGIAYHFKVAIIDGSPRFK